MAITKRIAAMGLLPLMLLGCGGSDDADFAKSSQLQAQAEAWENRMPTVILDGSAPTCTPLIVFFSIRAGTTGFPQEMMAESVSLSKSGAPLWQMPVSQSETGFRDAWVTAGDWLSLRGSEDGNPPSGTKTERIFSGVARGCTASGIAEGDAVTATVALTAGGQQATVSASIKLGAAY